MRDPQLGHLSLAAARGVVNSVVTSSGNGVVRSRCSVDSSVEVESTADNSIPPAARGLVKKL
jgi:hypothetical protein